MHESYIVEYLCRTIDNKNILSSNQIISILEELLIIYGITNITIENSNQDLYARYYNKKIIINTDKLIALCYLETIKNTTNIEKKILLINLRIIQIIIHEIQHIIQSNSSESFYKMCEQKEIYYKKEDKYKKREYLCNPLERIAEINSNSLLIDCCNNTKESKISNEFKKSVYSCLLYGYYIDSYEFPLNYYFDKNIPNIDVNYKNFIIGNQIDEYEYKMTLESYNSIRR